MGYAVIESGGKQYRVTPGDIIHVEKLPAQPGATVRFEKVLLAGDEATVRIGTPLLEGACVVGRVLRQAKAKKVLVFKKKRRKNYRRRFGHRQRITTVQVTAIQTSGSQNGTQEGTGE